MKILIFSNTIWSIHNFRKELINNLLKDNNKIYLAGKLDNNQEKFINNFGNIDFLNLKIEPRGINLIKELILIFKLYKDCKREKFDLILNFTIKPCLYGSIVGNLLNIKTVNTITGLGRMFSDKNKFKFIFIFLYKIFLKKASLTIFQNDSDKKFFFENKILNNSNNYKIVKGSGVNLNNFKFYKYPKINNRINFIMISRIINEKGVNVYLETAKYFKNLNKNFSFSLIGQKENELKLNRKVDLYSENKIINYLGFIENIIPIMRNIHFVILPTKYNEGIPKSLIESAALGKPIICSNQYGCNLIVKNNINGFIMTEVSKKNLIDTINIAVKKDFETLVKMGIASNNIANNGFSVDHVNKSYLDYINLINEHKE